MLQTAMRLNPQELAAIRQTVLDLAGAESQVRLFGSRLNDEAKGGDVDLLVELKHTTANPAWLAAQLAGRISRAMHGRKVDVLLTAPDLQILPIHEIARREGVLL